jgi:hypothetical protein
MEFELIRARTCADDRARAEFCRSAPENAAAPTSAYRSAA